MNVMAGMMVFLSVLFPSKTWYAPAQPLTIQVKPQGAVTLVLREFTGRLVEPQGDAGVAGENTVDLRPIFPTLATPGTYVLYAVPKIERPGTTRGAATTARASHDEEAFQGTPLIISVRQDKRRNAPLGAMVTKVEPLRYALLKTEAGELTLAFYYDVAPHTVTSFLALAEGGFYDGLSFHRIVPGFILQAGDPRGDGTGGPGYALNAEFNDRPHESGVLSMARTADDLERNPPYPMPRPEYANSAGSQFFICLDYANTKALDGRYTAFGRVVGGLEYLQALAAVPIANPQTGAPEHPPIIERITIKPVTLKENPYRNLKFKQEASTTQPQGTAR